MTRDEMRQCFASRAEMRVHKREELIKRFKAFEPMNECSDKERSFYLSSTINSSVKLSDVVNQKYIISDYKILEEPKVYSLNCNLMSITNKNVNGTHVRNPASLPIYIKKAFRPADDIVYPGDLLFIYEVMDDTEFAEMFKYTGWAMNYREYKDLEYFLSWYRKNFGCSRDQITLSRMGIAYEKYEKMRRTVEFVPEDYYPVFKSTNTYLYYY